MGEGNGIENLNYILWQNKIKSSFMYIMNSW